MEDILEDERLQALETERDNQLSNVETQYNDMANQSQEFYNAQIQANKDYAEAQSKLQQERTDLAIEQINQQKEQAQKDYTKEQTASYVDYQKQSNKFGVEAERMAAQGLSNTGVSESAQVQMYTAYQNRVASAKTSLNAAVLNYNNSIKEAQLSNNSALAEIANTALQQELQIALQGFQYKNSLLEAKQNQLNVVQNRYDSRYSEILNELQWEKDREESIRQWQEEFKEKVRQYDEDRAYRDTQLAQSKLEADRSYRLALEELELAKKKAADDSVKLTDDEEKEVIAISDTAFRVVQNGKTIGTVNITPGATNEQILAIGKQYGIDLSQYLS